VEEEIGPLEHCQRRYMQMNRRSQLVAAMLKLVLNILDRFRFNSLTAVIVIFGERDASATTSSKGVS
jgi:hypothetical protein